MVYWLLASCYAHMGRLAEAREIVTRLRVITPVVIPSVIPYRTPEHREHGARGSRLVLAIPRAPDNLPKRPRTPKEH